WVPWLRRRQRISCGEKLAWIGDLARHGGSGGCGGTGQQGTRASALTALEIAIARAHSVFAFGDDVAVHTDTHRAARFAPFGSGVDEYLRQAARLGFALDLLGAGHHQHPHAASHLAPLEDARSHLEIRQTRIRAAAAAHDIDRLALPAFPALQTHV